MSNVIEDKIRELAYILWQESGCPIGRDLDFWLQAEAALHHGAVSAPAPKAKKASAKPKAAAAPKAPAKTKAPAKPKAKPAKSV